MLTAALLVTVAVKISPVVSPRLTGSGGEGQDYVDLASTGAGPFTRAIQDAR